MSFPWDSRLFRQEREVLPDPRIANIVKEIEGRGLVFDRPRGSGEDMAYLEAAIVDLASSEPVSGSGGLLGKSPWRFPMESRALVLGELF